MKRLARGWSVLTVTALVAACASQDEAKRPGAQNGGIAETPVPPPTASQDAAVNEIAVTANQVEPRPVRGRAEGPSRSLKREADLGTTLQMATNAASHIAPAEPCCYSPHYQQPANTERYQHLEESPVRLVAEQPVSTFSIDVDTGAYANVRRFLNAGQLPPQDAVRVEEMINYFDYQYAAPESRATPFRVSTELAHAPWNQQSMLLKIGIKGFEIAASERPPANLVFLIDVSGSMQSPDKLPLLKNAFRLLTDQLTAKDRVSMVVYAGSSGVVLEPTAGDEKHKIRAAIDRLEAGGSTNGAAGIQQAYDLAHSAQIKNGINRVVLATDGDFNVGIVNFESLVDLAERQRESGVALTTLGFGTGNYNDQLLERLADAGNGNYSYVDTLTEARKVLVSELSSTLFTIAKDVKIQVEFNPAEVLEYRLIGYENRALAREDFNNDKVDAGDIGAGHRITALYEIVPVGGKGQVDPLRYGSQQASAGKKGEIANVRLRYKKPDSATSQLLEYPIAKASLVGAQQMSADFRFAASVAAFGQILRGGKYVGRYSYNDVAALAKGAYGDDGEGYRREFVSLVKLAATLAPAQQQEPERVGQVDQVDKAGP
jgi:Ca-activated chloride channel family protein